MAQSGNKEGMSEGEMAVLLTIVVIAIALTWYFGGKHIARAMAEVRYLELWLLSWWSGADDLRRKLPGLDLSKVTVQDFLVLAGVTGFYTRWLFVPPMLWLAYWVYTKSNRARFSRVHSMTSLAKSQAALWPEIAPVAGKQDELVKLDDKKGPWAVAMTEWEFAEKFKLAKRGQPQAMDEAKAREVFATQLGGLWPGVNGLPKHTRALYAALLYFIGGDGKVGGMKAMRAMAESIAKSNLDPNGLDDSFVAEALEKYGKHPLVLRAHEQHAYTFTVMATLLQLSRQAGVVASPLFVWVKTVDRRLWYILNNVGRYAFHVECAGIAAHWLFEKSVGVAVTSPMVDKAVAGLKVALAEYSEDDSLERIFH